MDERLSQWKEEHKYVYRTKVAGKYYYYFALSRDDYANIVAQQLQEGPNFDHDLEVFKYAVLSDYDTQELLDRAGIVNVIAEKILIASGFEVSEIEEL